MFVVPGESLWGPFKTGIIRAPKTKHTRLNSETPTAPSLHRINQTRTEIRHKSHKETFPWEKKMSRKYSSKTQRIKFQRWWGNSCTNTSCYSVKVKIPLQGFWSSGVLVFSYIFCSAPMNTLLICLLLVVVNVIITVAELALMLLRLASGSS